MIINLQIQRLVLGKKSDKQEEKQCLVSCLIYKMVLNIIVSQNCISFITNVYFTTFKLFITLNLAV